MGRNESECLDTTCAPRADAPTTNPLNPLRRTVSDLERHLKSLSDFVTWFAICHYVCGFHGDATRGCLGGPSSGEPASEAAGDTWWGQPS